jgi:hypothetical protein
VHQEPGMHGIEAGEVTILHVIDDKGIECMSLGATWAGTDVATCMDCHAENEPFTQGKENCMQCHGDKLINIKKSEAHEGLF